MIFAHSPPPNHLKTQSVGAFTYCRKTGVFQFDNRTQQGGKEKKQSKWHFVMQDVSLRERETEKENSTGLTKLALHAMKFQVEFHANIISVRISFTGK